VAFVAAAPTLHA
jgi:hypothetical protein